MKIYDEEVSREVLTGPDQCDLYYLRLRVFRLEDSNGAIPVYLYEHEYKSYVGESGRDRASPVTCRHKTYLYGPDSKHIRRAIATLDAFAPPKEASVA